MAKIMELPEGLEDLSSYFARHSFAMTLFNKTKSIDIVSAGLLKRLKFALKVLERMRS